MGKAVQASYRRAMRIDRARYNVLLLALCQALFATANTVVVTSSALAGAQLAPHSSLSTLPLGFQFVAAMAIMVPASLLMKRFGRRAGFAVGATFGLAAGALGATAILADRFWLFCLAAALYGGFIGCAQYYRFAAADAASESFRPRAISYVLAGGVVAALAGPELAKATNELFAPVLFAGCYVAIAALAAATLGVLAMVRIPPPSAEERAGGGRPLAIIARQPQFIVALLTGMVGYGSMVLIMTATPLAMIACSHVFADAAFVIQWHVLGMFAPSFVTGHLISRMGAIPVMLIGGCLILACIGVNLTGVELLQFWSALFLLGVGWNFTFVGATTLLTTTYAPAEKAKVQASNDLAIFTTVALASLFSGGLNYLVGWTAVNLSVAPLVLVMLTALLWLLREQRRTTPTLVAS